MNIGGWGCSEHLCFVDIFCLSLLCHMICGFVIFHSCDVSLLFLAFLGVYFADRFPMIWHFAVKCS